MQTAAAGLRTFGGVAAVVALAVLMAAGAPSAALAHGGGPVRAVWDDAQGFHMVIESNEDPAAGFLGGVVHVTAIPTASADSNVRLRGMNITVYGVGPDGRETKRVRAKWFNGPYEADLMVNKPGVWNIFVEVEDNGVVQVKQFPLEVAARSVVTDLALLGGMMMIPIFGIVGMVRLRKARAARRRGGTRSVGKEASAEA